MLHPPWLVTPAGETVAQCAEREVMEETGIRIRNSHSLGKEQYGCSNDEASK